MPEPDWNAWTTFSRDEDGAERRVAAGDSLPYQDQIWLDVPVLNRKNFSGAAHAAHDFVGDEQDFFFAADFCDARDVTFAGTAAPRVAPTTGSKMKAAEVSAGWSVEKFFEIVAQASPYSLRKDAAVRDRGNRAAMWPHSGRSGW